MVSGDVKHYGLLTISAGTQNYVALRYDWRCLAENVSGQGNDWSV